MWRISLLLALLVTACSKGPQADLPSIGEARSLVAEWALVNQQAAEGKVTTTYTETMRKEIREQLRQTQSALTQPKSPYGVEIQAALARRDDASPQDLRQHADRLKQIEDSLESA